MNTDGTSGTDLGPTDGAPVMYDMESFQWNSDGPVAANTNELFFLLCPFCKSHKDCSAIQLLKSGAWKSLGCKRCQRTSTTAKWLCECSVPWYACSTHAKYGHAAGSKQPSRIPKRQCNIHSSMYEEVGCSPCPLASSKRQKQGNAPPPDIGIHTIRTTKRLGHTSSGSRKKRRTSKESEQDALEAVQRLIQSRQRFREDPGLGRSSSSFSVA